MVALVNEELFFFINEAGDSSNFIKSLNMLLVHNKLVKFYFRFLIIFFHRVPNNTKILFLVIVILF